MVNLRLIFIFLLVSIGNLYPQEASNFFPSSLGFKWYYTETPLDSLNNPQYEFTQFRIDSLAKIDEFKSKNAYYVDEKKNLKSFEDDTGYSDQVYFYFENSDGWSYLQIGEEFYSVPYLDEIGILEFLQSIEGWYPVFRFAQYTYDDYLIFSKDTTFTYDTLSLPLRFSMKGVRLNDENVHLVFGDAYCKKFILTYQVGYLANIGNYTVEIPLLSVPDTVWISENIWKVKESRPSATIDLSSIGIPMTYTINGKLIELTSITVDIQNNQLYVQDFSLEQNYPNPFNSQTTISYYIPHTSQIKINIYNSLGKKILTLEDAVQPPGNHNINFDAFNLPSGIYFYELSTETFSVRKKMILIK